MRKVDNPKLRAKYSCQKSDAKRRGIRFLLTFDEWLDIWTTSGHIGERGNRAGYYVMARYGDRGSYEIGNVRIVLFEENAREYRPTLDAKTRSGAAHVGKIVSQATRRKLSKAATGRKTLLAPETASRLSSLRKRMAQSRSRNEQGQWLGGVSCHSR